MKKYSICFFAVYCICFLLLYAIYPSDSEEPGALITEASSGSGEAFAADVEVHNPMESTHIPEESSPSYLVYGGISEILICYPDSDTVYKRIPLIPEDLSQEDRDELVHGITFSSIEELYHYLESITS